MPTPSKTQLIGGSFQDASGNPLALGTLVMQLSQDALVSGVGQLSGGKTITILLDENGDVQGTSGDGDPAQYVWGTDVMSPAGVTYEATAYDADGQLSWGKQFGLPVISGSTYNLDNWTPAIVFTTLPSLGGLTLQTNGVNNPDQNLLNLIAGSNVTLSASDSGGVTIAATGGGGGTPIVFASDFSGGDWGAKVNAALASFSGAPGEVWIETSAGTSAIAADITLAAGQVLRWIQGGTFSLGTHSIVIPQAVNNCSVVGSPGGSTILSYTGTTYAIKVGAASPPLTNNTLFQDLTINLGSAAQGAYSLLCTLYCSLIRPIVNGYASAPYSPYGVYSDGTGAFSAYTYIEMPDINSCLIGVIFAGGPSASLNNANQQVGGGIIGPGSSVSGSIGCVVQGDSTSCFGTDVEDCNVAWEIANNFNLLSNTRIEGCNTMFSFLSSSSRNTAITITRPEFVTVSDVGQFNSVTSGAGLIQQTSLSNAGQVQYTFTEDGNFPLDVALRAGSTTDQQGNLQFQDHVGSVQFTLQKDSSNDFFILQQSKAAACFVVGASGAVGVNSNSGALNLNGSSGASTSGTAFLSGGSTPEIVSTIDGSGNLTVLPAALATTGNNDSPSISVDGNWSPEQASVTAVSVSSGVVTISGNFSAFSVGLQVTVLGLSNSANTWLNGIRLSVLTRSGSNMTANVSHSDYGTTSDSGTAYESEIDQWSIQNVVGTGATPTSTLTVKHTGSTGTASIDLEGVATAGSAGSASLYLPVLVNGSPYKIALLAP